MRFNSFTIMLLNSYNIFSFYELSYKHSTSFFSDYPTVKLSLSFESQPLKNGNTVILEAKIVSSPFPEDVVWTHNKKEIRKIDEADKLNQKLTIHNVSSLDNGEYLVTVKNALGSARDELEIKIEGKDPNILLKKLFMINKLQ